MPDNSQVVTELTKAYEEFSPSPLMKSQGSYGRTFDGFYGNTSVKSQYGRGDYNSFRRNEAKPKLDDEIIGACMRVYDNIGIIRNIIDLMGDFVCKGIRLVHKNPKTQKFYREWFEHVNGDHVSERFANYLYRIANVPVYKTYGTIPRKVQKKWESAYGIEFIDTKIEKRRIPLRYNFLNPLTIEPVLPELSMFTGKNLYVLKVSSVIRNAINVANSKYSNIGVQDIINMIPDELKKPTPSSFLPLSNDSLSIYHYKKDDWNTWAKPIIHSILDDVQQLEKMKLADISALDGVISNIRLWTVGKLTDNPLTTIIPSPSMLRKVQEVLAMSVGGGSIDFVWGPDLDFKESSTQVHKFLGIEKYKPVYHNIYQALGFGIALSGDSAGDSKVSMQTLIERLEYGRTILTDFWNNELKQIQLAMGFTSPAKVQFDRITFGDETGMMKLLIELSDRNIIPDEMIQEAFDYFPEITSKKLMKEYKARKGKRYVEKAGPYHNANIEDELKKIILQSGGVAPSEVGLELEEKKSGEEAMLDKTRTHEVKVAKIGGTNPAQPKKYAPPKNNGRPKNAKDTNTRKQRVAKGDTFVSRFLWANAAQKDISDSLTDIWVKNVCSKKDIRSLTAEESEELELTKFKILCSINPYSSVDMSVINDKLNNQNNQSITDISTATKALYVTFVNKNNREPSLEEKRQMQAAAYSLNFEESVSDPSTEDELNSSALDLAKEQTCK